MDKGELNVDPIQSEFFSTEAINGLTEALVREAVQNSLDAVEPGAVARVRFWFSGETHSLPPGKNKRYFDGLEEHIHAKESGLQHPPSVSSGVPFLLIEDFNTRGLTGNPEQEKDTPGKKNDFYYFWRNIGRSGKRGDDRGRWGLGKNVFPASSRINTFLGFTVRQEQPAMLLMGQSVLKVHELQGKRMYPYGYLTPKAPEDGFARPIDNDVELTNFRSDFSLLRSTEPGLSVVIPFPDDEITEARILEAALRQYFYPLLTGKLVITLGNPQQKRIIGQSTIVEIVKEATPEFRTELEPMLRLAEWASGVTIFAKAKAPNPKGAPHWEEDSLPAGVLENLRQEFEKGIPLALEVPVLVRPADGLEQTSYFRVFLQKDPILEPHRPTFIRDGLIVTDAVKTKLRGAHALVVIEDRPLATMLGDAENPAHTEWQSRSAHFRGRYDHGQYTLSYIKQSAAWLAHLLTKSQGEQDLSTLADVFYLDQPPMGDKQKSKVVIPKPGPTPPKPGGDEELKPQRLRISKIKGGFTLHPVETDFYAASVRVTTAYEVRRGNAFKRYQTADFEFGKAPIDVKTEGAPIIEQSGNHIVLGPLVGQFNVTVTGFDPARDLTVRALIEE
jgi:hypothetical protein